MSSILVLDDRPTNRDLLATVIKTAGHAVVEAADGEAALALVRQERPDLIIADILMPGMDGYEFTRHLRSDPEIAATRVVFYRPPTSRMRHDAWPRAVASTHVLVKPCEPDEILEVVARRWQPVPSSPPAGCSAPASDREHTRVVSDKLVAKIDELENLNRRYVELNERLQASELEYRLLFERNPLPMIVYEERVSYKILAANQSVRQQLRLLPGRAHSHGDRRPRAAGRHRGAAPVPQANPSGIPATASGDLPAPTWRHCYKDGMVIDVEVTTANLALQGRECRIAACST